MMSGLAFSKRLALFLLASGTAIVPSAHADPLADGFQNPPNSARPRVWWHWMNGNVTEDGITKDLEWMEKVGIGGMQNFDANLGTPQIVQKRLVYMDPDWTKAFKHAVELADKKGLEFAIAASPGWSETGGPWVKPEEGMKKLVWSETHVTGGKRFSGKIAPAPDVTGPFQTAKFFDFIGGLAGDKGPPPQQASGDVVVLAVPAMPAFATPTATASDGATLDVAKLVDADLESTVDVPTLDGDNPGGLTLSFAKPVTAQSLRFYVPHAKPPFYGPTFKPELQAEVGGTWIKLADVPLGEAATSVRFAPTTAQKFRILIRKNSGAQPAGLGGQAPGAIELNIFARPFPKSVKVAEVRLSGDPRLNQAEAKAGFDIVNNYLDVAETAKVDGYTPGQVINLTARMKPDGSLNWTPPKGSDWRIYRFGWSLTGKTNHPATPEATGLEVDKFDAAAVRRYLETYLTMYRNAVGPDLIGTRGIRALLTDSIEVGNANWTGRMIEEFRTRRGYDPTYWLPAMAGEVIGSAAESEKFLSDFRQTLADLMAEAHYGTVAKVAKEQNLIVYGEAHENGRPVLGDDLAMRKNANVPMAALWTWNRGEEPRATLLGDMKGAASVAHVYGQNLVAAESMTAGNSPWAFAPKDLKRIIDLEFAMGVNRPVIHTSVHQPVDDKKPGLSLMIFGQYFNRHESWGGMAKPWVDYMSRTSFLLQQGRNFADIAYFYGEEAPVTGIYEFGIPDGLPKRYAFDFVNADMLANALRVEGGEIVSTGGARYKALFLGGRSQSMTLATLKRVAAMVEAGATVIGVKPAGSPALKDDPVEFATLADRIWSNPKVIATNKVEEGMQRAGVAPDFAYRGMNKDTELLFVHRKLADGDVYWVNNRANRKETVSMSFRVAGKVPELWNPITGKSQSVTYATDNGTSRVDMEMGPEDASFILFRKPTEGTVNAMVAKLPQQKSTPINNEWQIEFEPGRGAPALAGTKLLKPLNEHGDPGIKYFSGVATYKTGFAVPKGHKAGAPLWLDLGEVGDVAEVLVNGQNAGTVWFAPYRVDIGKMLKIGSNSLEIRVANTWVNRLIGDVQPGAKKVTFVTAPTYKPTAPLRPSGLIGPVRLISGGD
jgi:hypothetical protein